MIQKTGVAIAVLIVAVSLTQLTVVKAQERESFRAFAVVMGVHATGQTNTFQITIDRWSTDEDREKLFATLVENDQDALIEALQDQDECGFLRMTGTQGPIARRSSFPSQRIKYARDIRFEDGKRRIILAFDRPIPYWEALNRPRTYDYPLSILVLNLDEDNKGEGVMAIGVRLKFDNENNSLEIENFSSQPVRLTNVRKTS